jgi:hypothetical protein
MGTDGGLIATKHTNQLAGPFGIFTEGKGEPIPDARHALRSLGYLLFKA